MAELLYPYPWPMSLTAVAVVASTADVGALGGTTTPRQSVDAYSPRRPPPLAHPGLTTVGRGHAPTTSISPLFFL